MANSDPKVVVMEWYNIMLCTLPLELTSGSTTVIHTISISSGSQLFQQICDIHLTETRKAARWYLFGLKIFSLTMNQTLILVTQPITYTDRATLVLLARKVLV